jgi:uncharacterized membrane protein
MKKLFIISVVAVIAMPLVPLSTSFAWHHEKPVTPYGDFCRMCSVYGSCRSTMSHEEAKRALINYYHKKGLGVELDRKRGRFIRAKIRDKKGVVDIIIFDRKTGRVRSIY